MSDVKIPSLTRSSRDSESREKSARRKPWAPPSRLDAPPAPPGYKHRWIRAMAGGQQDVTNVAGRLREGYELVRGSEYPDYHVPTVEDGRHAGVISVGKSNAHSSMVIERPTRQSRVSFGSPARGS